ncbi:hypothetical protein BB561_004985 [Smittium simulii]|uniref:N-acetyltransferase domain-containing protein n=1 Tax=Smittium simulii TaxID=133385 RepID=A0A2T9YD31_9FUNG|nr:hypothetical protein BB561_004985 [Smittium simulii]
MSDTESHFPNKSNSVSLKQIPKHLAQNYRLRQITEKKEWQVLSILQLSNSKLLPSTRRLKRRLQLRRLKKMIGAPLIVNIDDRVAELVKNSNPFEIWCPNHSKSLAKNIVSLQKKKLADFDVISTGNLYTKNILENNLNNSSIKTPLAQTAYENSFASRLYGKTLFPNSLVPSGPKISPFLGKILRPFIWSFSIPYQKLPPFLLTLKLIQARCHPIFQKLHLSRSSLPLIDTDTIYYTYFTTSHLDQVSRLLENSFWPNIDMNDALSCPEFSIIALYKRTVVGCAFLTPDAYLNYIAVLPGWERIGVASFMLFYLIQAIPTKDITLNVSATNPAMLLYQRFGFKPEKFALDFYSYYLSKSSPACKDAFFMRLRRT